VVLCAGNTNFGHSYTLKEGKLHHNHNYTTKNIFDPSNNFINNITDCSNIDFDDNHPLFIPAVTPDNKNSIPNLTVSKDSPSSSNTPNGTFIKCINDISASSGWNKNITRYSNGALFKFSTDTIRNSWGYNATNLKYSYCNNSLLDNAPIISVSKPTADTSYNCTNDSSKVYYLNSNQSLYRYPSGINPTSASNIDCRIFDSSINTLTTPQNNSLVRCENSNYYYYTNSKLYKTTDAIGPKIDSSYSQLKTNALNTPCIHLTYGNDLSYSATPMISTVPPSIETTPNGTNLKCVDSSSNITYRFYNGQLYSYANDNIKRSWSKDGTLNDFSDNNLKYYFCGNLLSTATNIPFRFDASNATTSTDKNITCKEYPGKYYYYNSLGKALYEYYDSGGRSYTEHNCLDTSVNTILDIPNENTINKCNGENTFFYQKEKSYFLPTSALSLINSNYMSVGNNNIVDCSKIANSNKVILTTLNDFVVTPNNRDNVKCISNTMSTDPTYRYVNGNLYKYDNDAIKNSWASESSTVTKNYICSSSKISENLVMQAKPTIDTTVKCTNNNNFYHYNKSNNTFYQYTDPSVNMVTPENQIYNIDCDHFSPFTTQTLKKTVTGINNGTIKCDEDDTYYYYDGSKKYKYSDASSALLMDPSYVVTGNNNIVVCNDPTVNLANGLDIRAPAGTTSISKTTPNPSQLVKCINDTNSNRIYKNINNTWMYYPTNDIASTWESTLTSNYYFCSDSFMNSATSISAKPSISQNIKCLDGSKNYFYYNHSNTSLYQYPIGTDGIQNAIEQNCNQYSTTSYPRRNLTDLPSEGKTVRCIDNSNNYYFKDSKFRLIDNDIGPTTDPSYTTNINNNPFLCSSMTSGLLGSSVKWPLENTDLMSCMDVSGVYMFTSTMTGNQNNIKKYPTNNTTWLDGKTIYNYYNCNSANSKFIRSDISNGIPSTTSLIQCTDKNNDYYRLDVSTNTLRRILNNDIGISNFGSYSTSSAVPYECKYLLKPYGEDYRYTTVPSLEHNDLIKDTSSNLYYRYNSGSNQLQKIVKNTTDTDDSVGKSWAYFDTLSNRDNYYTSRSISKGNYIVDYLNITKGPDVSYKTINDFVNGEFIKCGNDFYMYDASINSIRKIPENTDSTTVKVGTTWISSYPNINKYSYYDSCTLPTGPNLTYKLSTIPNNTIMFCVNNNRYGLFSDNSFAYFSSPGAAYKYNANYASLAVKYNSDYLGLTPRSDIRENNFTVNTIVNCLDNTTFNLSNSFAYYYYRIDTPGVLYSLYNDTIAKSWDEKYTTNAVSLNCNNVYTLGDRMDYKDLTGIVNGSIVKCTDLSIPFNYYRYNSVSRQFENLQNDYVAKSWSPNYLTRAITSKCANSSIIYNDVILEFNNDTPLENGAIVRCKNESISTFPYYYYDASTNRLKKLLDDKMATTWKQNYLTELVTKDTCNVISLIKGTSANYNITLNNDSFFKCDPSTNYYKYDSSTDKIRKIVNDDIGLSWSQNFKTDQSYNCNFLGKTMGPDQTYKTNFTNGTIIKCSDPQHQTNQFSFYRYTNEKFASLTSDDVAKSWNPNYNDGVTTYDCNYLDASFEGSLKYNIALSQGNLVKCVNETDFNYYLFDASVNKLRSLVNDNIAVTWNQNYITNSMSIQNCNNLSQTKGTSLTYNRDFADGTILKCNNESGYPYYLFEASSNNIYNIPSNDIAITRSIDVSGATNVSNCSKYSKGSPLTYVKQFSTGDIVNCNSNYYLYNSNKFQNLPNQSVARSWNSRYDASAVLMDCSYVNETFDSNPLMYNNVNLNNGDIVKCSNESGFHFYYYNANQLNKFDSDDMLNSWTTNYVAKDYSCNYLNVPKGSAMEYKPLADKTIVKCTNENKYYSYDLSSNKIRWFPNDDIAKSWNANYISAAVSRDCSKWTSVNKGETMPLNITLSNNDIVYCSDENVSTFPYYIYSNNMLNKISSHEMALKYNPNYLTQKREIKYCEYAGIPKSGQVDIDLTFNQGDIVKCINETDFPYYMVEDQSFRKFPNDSVATSWNRDYASIAIQYDCSKTTKYTKGDIKKYNPPADNTTIKCENTYYNYSNKTLTKYPNPGVAQSWDPNFSTANTYDCSFMDATLAGTRNYKMVDVSNITLCTNETDLPYYLYNSTNKKYDKFPTQDVLLKTNALYESQSKPYDCNYITDFEKGNDIKYPIPPEGTFVKCQDDKSSFPFYRVSNQTLYKLPNDGVARKYRDDYSNNAVPYENCSNFDITKDTTYYRLNDNSSVKCGDSRETFPYYRYSGNTLNKYPNEDVAKSWDTNYESAPIKDCNYLNISTGNVLNYATKPNDNTIIECSNETGFPYYNYASDKLTKYPNEDVIKSWNPNYQTQSIKRDCNYLGSTKNSNMMNYKMSGLTNNTTIKCIDDNKYYQYTGTELQGFLNDDILASWNPNYSNSNAYNCNYLDVKKSTTVISQPNKPNNNESIKCTNIDDPFPYYRYNQTTNQLQKYNDLSTIIELDPMAVINGNINVTNFNCNNLGLNGFGSLLTSTASTVNSRVVNTTGSNLLTSATDSSTGSTSIGSTSSSSTTNLEVKQKAYDDAVIAEALEKKNMDQAISSVNSYKISYDKANIDYKNAKKATIIALNNLKNATSRTKSRLTTIYNNAKRNEASKKSLWLSRKSIYDRMYIIFGVSAKTTQYNNARNATKIALDNLKK
jgi:hypothetical protein